MQKTDALAEIFHEMTASLTHGLVCYVEAMMLSDYLTIALMAVNTSTIHPAALSTALQTSYRSFDNWHYLAMAGLFVYSTTLLDTFLSETATFLYTYRPQALGTDLKIPISAIVSADSKFTVINDAVEKRVRAMGFETFTARLKTFERVFGINLELTERDITVLEACTQGRNQFIHDQGLYRLRLCEHGDIIATKKACPVHTRDIPRGILTAALQVQTKICGRLYRCVIEKILKIQDPKYVTTAEWIETFGQLAVDAMAQKVSAADTDDRGLPIDLPQKWKTKAAASE